MKLLSVQQTAKVVPLFALSVASASIAAADEPTVQWQMQSSVPSSVTLLGTHAKRFTEKIEVVSGGEFRIGFHEPGALVPPLEIFDAVSKGSIDAGWAPPGFWAGKIRAAPLFAAVPFGPAAAEYLAWIRYGGGQEIWQEILAPYDIHSIFCNITAPEASGWFREAITSIEQLKGLKMRFFGLGALVIQKLGASTQLLAPPDVYPALERGVIDAAELSMPAVDISLGLHKLAKHYYLPGWHQQATLGALMINTERWMELSDMRKAQVEITCGASMLDSLAEAEAVQFEALKKLEKEGVELHRWPPEMLAAFEAAWQEVAEEQAAADPDFKRAWDSLQAFRADYQIWKDLGYLD